MKKIKLHLSLIVFTACLSTSISSQTAFSATQNWLTGVNFETCMQRSREALAMNGFSATAQNDKVSHIGFKPDYSAFLLCQACGDKTITTIVLHNAKGGSETDALREQMLYYIATGLTGTTSGSGNLYTIKNVFNPGERIVIEYKNMAGNSSDWINIVPVGSSDEIPGNWQYINGKKTGQVSFDPQKAGEYEARAFFNNSYKVEYRYRFRVGGSSIPVGGNNPPVVGRLLKLDKTRFAANEKIDIHFFYLAGNTSDWINIVPKGTPDGSAGNWQYTAGLKTGKLTFAGMAAGEYETRVFYNNSYKVEDRLFFTVQIP